MVITKDLSTKDYKTLLLNRLEVSLQQYWTIVKQEETTKETDAKHNPLPQHDDQQESKPSKRPCHDHHQHHHYTPHQFLQDPHARAQDMVDYLKLLVLLDLSTDEIQAFQPLLEQLLYIPHVQATARAVQTYWNSQTLSVQASEILQAYSQRQHEIATIDRKRKPDMIAFKELRKDTRCGMMSREPAYGLIPGVPLGFRFRNRGQAAITGVHTQILRGIDSVGGRPAYAVCMSDGPYIDEDYEIQPVVVSSKDAQAQQQAKQPPQQQAPPLLIKEEQQQDEDDRGASSSSSSSDADACIWYMGEGGVRKGKLVQDQTENAANQALLRSYRTGQPLRLIRRGVVRGSSKPKEFYYEYHGLYKCLDYTYDPVRPGGPKAYRFKLAPVMELTTKKETAADKDSSKSGADVGEYQSWFAVLRALDMI